jgi:hypothetical protein
MGTIVTDPAVSSDPHAQERSLQQSLSVLQTPGRWPSYSGAVPASVRE